MQRTAAVFFLLIATAVSGVGTSGLLLYQHALHHSAEKKTVADAALTLIDISSAKYQSLHIERLNKDVSETNIDGVMMDIYKTEQQGNNVTLYVIIDKKETAEQNISFTINSVVTHEKQPPVCFCSLLPFHERSLVIHFQSAGISFAGSFFNSHIQPFPYLLKPGQPPDIS